MVNAWIEHVKKYAKENNISYGCAITEAKASYVKKTKKTKEQLDAEDIKAWGNKLKILKADYKRRGDDEDQINLLKMRFSKYGSGLKDYIKSIDNEFYNIMVKK